MSSRKSDIPAEPSDAVPGGAAPGGHDRGAPPDARGYLAPIAEPTSAAPAAGVVASEPPLAPMLPTRSTGWRDALLANGPLPLLVLLLIPIGWALQSRGFGAYNARIVMLIGFNIILAVGLQLINGYSGQFSLGHAGFMAVGAYLAAYPTQAYAHLDGTSAGLQRIDHPAAVLLFFVGLGAAIAIGGGVLWALVALLGMTRRANPALPAVLMVLLIVWFLIDVSRSTHHATPPPYLLWSWGGTLLRRMFGAIVTSGLPLAGRASSALPAGLREPLCFIILVFGGGTFAAATGFVVGLPTLRLRGDYLAIATLGLAEIIRIAIINSEPLGGALGLGPIGIPRYTDFAWLYAAVILSVAVVWRIAYSAKGRAIQAVREDEIAAAAIGIDPTRQKVFAFVVGAFIGGVAGAMFALYERSITPGYFGLQKSIEVVVIVTLGGLGSISGAILAAIVLTLLPEVLRPVQDYRMIIYALLLIVMMLLRPQGLLGGRELWPRRRRRQGTAEGGRQARRDDGAEGGRQARRHEGAEARREKTNPSALTTEHSALSTDPSALSTVPRLSTAPSALEAHKVARRFGGLCALDNFSLRVCVGDLVGLIGPNGAGKTTAFNLITGVYAPTAGEITLGGQRISGLSPVAISRSGIGRTFQNIRLFKSLTALDNVAAGFNRPAEHGLIRTVLRTPSFFRAQQASIADAMALLATLGLAGAADQPADSLPYGDQRRLEIARALATRPKILLLDEPAAGMNPQEKVELMELIRFIRDRFGVGIWLIEHDMKLVMTICERITVLDHGETIAVGTPAEVQANPDVIEAYLGEDVGATPASPAAP